MTNQWSRRRDRTGRSAGSGAGSGFLGDLVEVFQPSRRHVVAEQERRRDHVQLPESGDPPLVDLDAGVAHLAPSPGTPPVAGRDAPPADDETGLDPDPPGGTTELPRPTSLSRWAPVLAVDLERESRA